MAAGNYLSTRALMAIVELRRWWEPFRLASFLSQLSNACPNLRTRTLPVSVPVPFPFSRKSFGSRRRSLVPSGRGMRHPASARARWCGEPHPNPMGSAAAVGCGLPHHHSCPHAHTPARPQAGVQRPATGRGEGMAESSTAVTAVRTPSSPYLLHPLTFSSPGWVGGPASSIQRPASGGWAGAKKGPPRGDPSKYRMN